MLKKALIGVAILLALGLVAGGVAWWQINHIVQRGVETLGPRLTGVAVTVAEVDLALLSGAGTLRGLRVANPSGFSNPEAITVDEISVRLAPRSLFGKRIVVHEIVIKAPAIAYEVTTSGTNIGAIQAHVQRVLGEPSATPSDTKLVIEQLQVSEGQMAVNLLGSGNLTLKLAPVALANLGGSEGLESAQLVGDILLILTNSIIATVTDSGLAKGAVSGAQQAVSGAGKAVGSLIQGLGNMLPGGADKAPSEPAK